MMLAVRHSSHHRARRKAHDRPKNHNHHIIHKQRRLALLIITLHVLFTHIPLISYLRVTSLLHTSLCKHLLSIFLAQLPHLPISDPKFVGHQIPLEPKVSTTNVDTLASAEWNFSCKQKSSSHTKWLVQHPDFNYTFTIIIQLLCKTLQLITYFKPLQTYSMTVHTCSYTLDKVR